MTKLASIFAYSFFIGFSGAVMPGPLLALTLKESLGRGKTAALWLSIGHSLCELAIVGLFAGGLSKVIPVQAVSGPVGLVGGAVLVWMAYGAFRQSQAALEPVEAADAPSLGRSLIVGGAAVTVSNPYWLLWWLTVGMGLLLSAQLAGTVGVVTFYIGHILSDFVWFGFVGFVVGSRRQMLSGRLYRGIVFVCAIFLLGFGLWFMGYGAHTVRLSLIH